MNERVEDAKTEYRQGFSRGQIGLAVTGAFDDYALIDCGHGRKLERFGGVLIDRPEPQAMWPRHVSEADWERADGVFVGDEEGENGRWRFRGSPAKTWAMRVSDVEVSCRFTNFRHVGVFPEQMSLWTWMLDALARCDEE